MMKKIQFIRCGVILFVPLLSYAGPIPEALGALTNLVTLNLRNNKLTGKLATFGLACHPPIFGISGCYHRLFARGCLETRGTGGLRAIHASQKCGTYV